MAPDETPTADGLQNCLDVSRDSTAQVHQQREALSCRYNIGQVAIGMGDTNLAHQAFKIAVTVDPTHAESLNNLGVLDAQKGDMEAAAAHYRTSQYSGPALFEPLYNGALADFKAGEYEKSYELVLAALAIFPAHSDSQDLAHMICTLFCIS